MKFVLFILFITSTLCQNQVFNQIEENPIPTLVIQNEESQQEQQQQTQQHQQLQGYIDIDGRFVSNQMDNSQNENPIQQNTIINNEQEQNNNMNQDDFQNLTINDGNRTQQLVSTDAELDPMLDMENSMPYEFPEDQIIQEDQQNEENDNHYLSASLELPIRNENQYYDSLGNQIDSYDGMKTYLAMDSAEIDLNNANISVDEQQEDCIVIYSKCDYQGESLPICESLKEVEDFQYDIKSIYLPDGYEMTIYSEENFEGQQITYNESQKCLAQSVSLAQLRGQQTQKEDPQIQKEDPNQMILTQNLRIRN